MTTSVMEAPSKLNSAENNTSAVSNGKHTVTIEMIVAELQHLPTDHLNDVFQYVQFLEYKLKQVDESEEDDEALWDAVLVHQVYKTEHPEEQPLIFENAEDYLRSLNDRTHS